MVIGLSRTIATLVTNTRLKITVMGLSRTIFTTVASAFRVLDTVLLAALNETASAVPVLTDSTTLLVVIIPVTRADDTLLIATVLVLLTIRTALTVALRTIILMGLRVTRLMVLARALLNKFTVRVLFALLIILAVLFLTRVNSLKLLASAT